MKGKSNNRATVSTLWGDFGEAGAAKQVLLGLPNGIYRRTKHNCYDGNMRSFCGIINDIMLGNLIIFNYGWAIDWEKKVHASREGYTPLEKWNYSY